MDWLLIIVLLPLLASVAVGFVPGSQRRAIRGITLGASGLTLLCALIAFGTFKVGGGLQFETRVVWVESLGLHFHLRGRHQHRHYFNGSDRRLCGGLLRG